MRAPRQFLMLLALAGALAGCAGATVISPNDPDYGRNGAPRVGEYYTVRGPYQPLGSGGPSGGAGGM
jgi:hypothetical protein